MAMQYLGTGLLRVADVGLATGISAQHLAAPVNAIRTSGYSAHGKGAATYVSDALATAGLAAAHPRVCKQSLDGRYWRLLVEDGIHTPFQFGALSDGADDTAALLAMAAYVNTLYDGAAADSFGNVRFPQVVFPDCAGFRVAATAGVGLALRAGVQIDMALAPLLITGAANAVIVGFHHTNPHPGDYSAPRRGHSVLDVRRVTGSDWSNEGDLAVKVDAAYAAHYTIKRLENFCVGGEFCLGYGLIEGGEIVEFKKGLIVTARAAPENFTNQIALRDIEFTTRGASNTARYGLVLKGVAPAGINTVSLDNLSFELAKSLAGAQDCLDLLIDAGASNIGQVTGRNLRTESGGDVHVRTLGAVRDVDIEYNHAELAYDHPEGLFLDDQSTGAGAIAVRRAHNANGRQWQPFFATGRLAENALKTSSGHCFIRKLESATNVGAFPATQTFETGNFEPTFYADGSMDGGSLYGTRVALNGARSLAIRGRKPAGQAANLIVLLFDAGGVQLGTDNLVWCEQFGSACNTAIYGGAHSVAINPANACTAFEAVLGFAASVATAFITVTSRVMEWELLAADKRPVAFSLTSAFKGRFIANNAIPVALTNVTYATGMRVDNLTVASYLPSGWRFTGSAWEVADVIADGAVTNVQLANMATATIKGRVTAGTGAPENLTAAQARTLLNVADGATANSADATLLARANHTGTQAAATISDFTEASQDVVGAMVAAAGGTYNDGAGTITLPGAGGGTLVNNGITTVNFGAFPGASDASVTVTGQDGIVAGSRVKAYIIAKDTADHSADEHWAETLGVMAGNIAPGTGFTIYAKNTGALSEPVTQSWANTRLAGPGTGTNQTRPDLGGGQGTRLYGQYTVAWEWI